MSNQEAKIDNVLLIFPTPIRHQEFLNSLLPLGILGIASFLESKGIKAEVIDCHVQKDKPDFSKYDAICFSINIANVQNTIGYIKEIKANGGKQKIIIGGPQKTSRAEFWIRECGVDAIVIGDG